MLVMTSRSGMGVGKEAQEEGDLCIIMADLHVSQVAQQ